MCGRFTLKSETGVVLEEFEIERCPLFEPRFNVAPGQRVAVVGQHDDGRRLLRGLEWGLIPSSATDPKIGRKLTQARAETVGERRSYREAFQTRRCLIVADGFYEWQAAKTGKLPWYVQRRDRAVFGFAALWERWRAPDGAPRMTCCLLTRDANGGLEQLHDRMPVVMRREDYATWLDPCRNGSAVRNLLGGVPGQAFDACRVALAVNDFRNDGPELIVPITE